MDFLLKCSWSNDDDKLLRKRLYDRFGSYSCFCIVNILIKTVEKRCSDTILEYFIGHLLNNKECCRMYVLCYMHQYSHTPSHLYISKIKFTTIKECLKNTIHYILFATMYIVHCKWRPTYYCTLYNNMLDFMK